MKYVLVPFALAYLVGAFHNASFDITAWDPSIRGSYAVVLASSLALGAISSVLIEDEKRRDSKP